MEWLETSKVRYFISFCHVFLFVLQNEIYIIKIKKQNDVFEMSILFDSITKRWSEI